AGAPSLVVVGREPAARRADGVVDVGRVPDDAWSALLAGASAFCYPTRFEGFGMPALEAAASGVPVVCARVGPLPEVLGDAAEWCPSPNATDIAAGLERVLCDRDRRDWLRHAGIRQAQNAPTWSASADIVAAAYRQAAS
ncbi:MAG: glycosyltransferase, partial [Acidimicrobiales bacterium]